MTLLTLGFVVATQLPSPVAILPPVSTDGVFNFDETGTAASVIDEEVAQIPRTDLDEVLQAVQADGVRCDDAECLGRVASLVGAKAIIAEHTGSLSTRFVMIDDRGEVIREWNAQWAPPRWLRAFLDGAPFGEIELTTPGTIEGRRFVAGKLNVPAGELAVQLDDSELEMIAIPVGRTATVSLPPPPSEVPIEVEPDPPKVVEEPKPPVVVAAPQRSYWLAFSGASAISIGLVTAAAGSSAFAFGAPMGFDKDQRTAAIDVGVPIGLSIAAIGAILLTSDLLIGD